MLGLTDHEVGELLLPMLDEGARAHRHRTGLYVEPHDGLIALINSRRHHFVVGRRGVGKSTLLAQVGRADPTLLNSSPTVYIDLETVRTPDYGTTVLHLLVVVLSELRKELGRVDRKVPGSDDSEWFATDFQTKRPRRRPKTGDRPAHGQGRRSRQLRAEALKAVDATLGKLRAISESPESLDREVLVERTTSKGAAGAVMGRPRVLGGVAGAEGTVVAGASESRAEKTLGKERRSREEAVMQLLPEIREALENTVALAGEAAFVLLDDFHHIPMQQQALVLSMLHQVVKNQDVYLKVGSVKHRLYPYVEGDPPIGLQVGHDAGEVDLDLTLDRFAHVQHFLEEVLEHTIRYSNVRIEDFISKGARRRLTLASGAVARDYLHLLSLGLRQANERSGTKERPRNYVVAKDIHETCQELTELKYMDLRSEVGPLAAELQTAFSKIASFCLDDNRTNAFLVDASSFVRSELGRHIAALSDLRFVHRVGRVTVPELRGRQFVGFVIDLSSYVGLGKGEVDEIRIWDETDRQRLSQRRLVLSE